MNSEGDIGSFAEIKHFDVIDLKLELVKVF